MTRVKCRFDHRHGQLTNAAEPSVGAEAHLDEPAMAVRTGAGNARDPNGVGMVNALADPVDPSVLNTSGVTDNQVRVPHEQPMITAALHRARDVRRHRANVVRDRLPKELPTRLQIDEVAHRARDVTGRRANGVIGHPESAVHDRPPSGRVVQVPIDEADRPVNGATEHRMLVGRVLPANAAVSLALVAVPVRRAIALATIGRVDRQPAGHRLTGSGLQHHAKRRTHPKRRVSHVRHASGRRYRMNSAPGDGWVIAIDGPAGAGKTTVGRGVAEALHALDFDTGVLYRLVTYRALVDGVAVSDAEALARIARELTLQAVRDGVAGTRLVVAGVEDASALRSPEVDRNLSVVSAHLEVRSALVGKQREIARLGRVVLIGRDIGTVIVPDAPLKIYLEASSRERARRRYEELRQRGVEASYEQVLEDLERRDRLDSERAASPLRPADDALLIDTDGMPAAEVVLRIVSVAHECIPQLAEVEG